MDQGLQHKLGCTHLCERVHSGMSYASLVLLHRLLKTKRFHCFLPAVLVEVVQDACALLECQQPLELCGAIRPVQELAALVPRMVSWAGQHAAHLCT